MTDGLLDTTFFIDVRRGGDAGADKIWDEIRYGSRTGAFSAVTAYELWIGQRFSREEELLYESMFAVLEGVPIAVADASRAGQWLRGLTDRAESIFRDALIASSAHERDEAVITRNVRDFERLPGVRVESD